MKFRMSCFRCHPLRGAFHFNDQKKRQPVMVLIERLFLWHSHLKHTIIMSKFNVLWVSLMLLIVASCTPAKEKAETNTNDADDWQPNVEEAYVPEPDEDGFAWQTDQFADVKIIRYQIPNWDSLTVQQKEYAYYLTQASLAGRDMMYDQNYRHNLTIRRALENIYENFDGDRGTIGWNRFETYLKRIWFSNGIHHHYSNSKILPAFSREYFDELTAATNTTLSEEVLAAIFDP